MSLSQTYVRDHAFSLSQPFQRISPKTIKFLLKDKFDGESEIPTINRLFNLIKKCIYGNIYDENIK